MPQIRFLQEKDVLQVVDLEERILGETLGKEMLTDELNKDITKFWVIIDDEHLIGYIGGYFVIEQGEILNFVIDEKYQRQGYGQCLFNEVLTYAKKRSLSSLTLEVKENNNKGLNFYKKNGFTPINIRKNYYGDGTNAIVMLKVIE